MPDIVFMGTPDFAVPSMAYLLKAELIFPCWFVNRTRKKEEGINCNFPTKQFALDHGIEVYQPTSVRTPETIAILKERQPEFCIVIAYGKILPTEILNLPEKGASMYTPHCCQNGEELRQSSFLS